MREIEAILIVDDNKTTLRLNKWLLEELELTKDIFVKDSGEEALTFIKDYYAGKENYGKDALLVFCDVNMPGIDGEQFVELVKSDGLTKSKDIIIVLFSAFISPHAKKYCKEKNIAFLEKPLNEEKIAFVVNQFLN